VIPSTKCSIPISYSILSKQDSTVYSVQYGTVYGAHTWMITQEPVTMFSVMQGTEMLL
jgi:hypothetical protein